MAAVDSAGRLRLVDTATDDADIRAAIAPFTTGDCVVAIDAPLIVANRTGHRPAEAAFNRDFARFHAGARPAFSDRPELEHPRAARLADALGLDMDPESTGRRRAIEVYPHPATVVLFDLDKTLKYKRGALDARKRNLLTLIDLVERLEAATPPMFTAGTPAWDRLRERVTAATRPSQLDRDEDPVDAVICAYIGSFRHHRPEDVTTYGDFATGYLVTPTLPSGRRLSPATAPDASGR